MLCVLCFCVVASAARVSLTQHKHSYTHPRLCVDRQACVCGFGTGLAQALRIDKDAASTDAFILVVMTLRIGQTNHGTIPISPSGILVDPT